MGNALDAAGPELLVELGVEADVVGAHRLLGELDYRLDGMGGPLLERTAVHALVQVDCVFTGDNVLEGRTRLAGLISCRIIGPRWRSNGRWDGRTDSGELNS